MHHVRQCLGLFLRKAGKSLRKFLVPLLMRHIFHVEQLQDGRGSSVLDSWVTTWN